MSAPEKPPVAIQPLQSDHDRAVFSCGVEALDRYLHHQAGQDVRKHVAATFVAVESGSPQVLGFYTLSATNQENHRSFTGGIK